MEYMGESKDLLSNAMDGEPPAILAATVFAIHSDPKVVTRIKNSYWADPWCLGLLDDIKQEMVDMKLNISMKHGLLFIGGQLVHPRIQKLTQMPIPTCT
jgi:hypothetical protein